MSASKSKTTEFLSLKTSLHRRELLRLSAAGAVALATRDLWGAEAGKPGADELIAGKDRRLVVHNAKPLEIETPLELLRDENVTPAQMLFVRNNYQPDWALSLKPQTAKDWKLEIAGLVEYPRTITLARLAELPQVEQEMVLQCSGNGRAMFNRAAPAKGAQWANGAVANVRFRGVPLRAVLEAAQANPHPSVRFVTAEGADKPSSPSDADFEHSIPLSDALDRSLVALELNGQPIPAVHGGPLRLITPGYYGTMQVKWLSRIRLEAEETANHHQVKRYRTPLRPIEPGSKFDYNQENSEPNWGMRIKSLIFAPLEGERIAAGPVVARGMAWNDGMARIEAVEWSLDGGQRWTRAELTVPASPYAWYPWQAPLTVSSGQQTLVCRAVDALGRTQPLNGAIDWNPAGYGWHGLHAVSFRAG
jgi:DMSO/TMAO reductase YedYZ molybdopterin-dependent catalytic subunit